MFERGVPFQLLAFFSPDILFQLYLNTGYSDTAHCSHYSSHYRLPVIAKSREVLIWYFKGGSLSSCTFAEEILSEVDDGPRVAPPWTPALYIVGIAVGSC